MRFTDIDTLSINTIRTLTIDAVQKSNSGHPGAPMALAPVAYCLWQEFLRYDPENAEWPNRDRFVLSNGHASMLLYGLLHLAGVKNSDGTPAVSLDDIKAFRQLGSRCPGHPEYGMTTGVESTTGPLGQGIATSVGMAIASLWLAAHFNRPGHRLFDYRVWAICSDGDLMEGISQEAGSLAGHLRLSNLCWIYDNNRVTIDGYTAITFTENTAERFHASGWRVLHVKDANDLDALTSAFETAASPAEGPTLVIVDTTIGYGSPHKQGTPKAHSDALGEEEVRLTKQFYRWPEDSKFRVPDGVRERFDEKLGARGRRLTAEWRETLAAYRKDFPEPARELDLLLAGDLPDGCDENLPEFPADEKGMATRVSSGKTLGVIADRIPWFLGGAADLVASTKTVVPSSDWFAPGNYGGRNIHFGVREHAMCAALNGMALSGLRTFGASFLIFSDYARPAIRLSALMELPTIWVFTHDSVELGEDGPTHQPVEQLASFRAVPGMNVFRPADAGEVNETWRVALRLKGPVLIALTRQDVPTIDRLRYASAAGVSRGAYVLADSDGKRPEVLLLGSGSEVALCLEAFEELKQRGIASRVVSMPSWDLFERQSEEYRREVLPSDITARVGIEAAASFGWDRYLGSLGIFLGMKSFGVSAPRKNILTHFGFTARHVVDAATSLLSGAQIGGDEKKVPRIPS